MCHKAILENGRTLKSVPDCYKNEVMYNKAVDNYPNALEFKTCAIKLSVAILLQ